MSEQITTTTNVMAQMKELVELKGSFQKEQITFIKNLINPDLTDNELYMFLNYANKSGLNPFNREIYAIVYGKNSADRRVNTIIARDGKRRKAYEKGGIETIETDSIWIKEDPETKQVVKVQPWEGGRLWGATCTVIRNEKKYIATVSLNEYNSGKSTWSTKPETMIKKVAESQALSMAVPELLGTYDESEMSIQEMPTAQVPASTTDNEPATDAQKKTIEALAHRNGLNVNVEEMTQATAKAWIAGVNQK